MLRAFVKLSAVGGFLFVSTVANGTVASQRPTSELFASAEEVLLVQITEGRTLNTSSGTCGARYAGVVERSFKGSPNGSRVEFGPFQQLRVGGYYLVFLSSTPNTVSLSGAEKDIESRCIRLWARLWILQGTSGAMPVESSCSNVDDWRVTWGSLVTVPAKPGVTSLSVAEMARTFPERAK